MYIPFSELQLHSTPFRRKIALVIKITNEL